MTNKKSGQVQLLSVIRSVRNRWRLRIATRGLAIVLGFGFLAFLVSAYGMDYFRFTDTSVTVFRIVAYSLAVGLALKYLFFPLARRVPDSTVALYIEEHEPSLNGSLVSAVELGQPDAQQWSPALTERLVLTAVSQCESIENGRRIERTNIYRSSGMLAGVMAMAAGVIFFSPLFLSNGMPFLLGTGATDGESPYAVAVSPGSITVARGADERIVATLVGFVSDEVEIATRRGEEGEWERSVMLLDEDEGGYMILLFDLTEATDYYIEASNVRSGVFRIEVEDVPYVERMDLLYDFPAYTRLDDDLVEDGGDVAALPGTGITIHLTPTVGVPAGRLVMDSGDSIPLVQGDDGRWTASFRVSGEDYYHIELQRFDGEFMVSSRDYSIFPLDDQPPIISFETPGRDVKVSSIEEVFTELNARDDYGLRIVELVYSLNGGEEQVVPLHSGSRRREVTAGHTFFLEDFEMVPGDFVSYYGRSVDNNAVGGRQTTTTDIYFMSIRPFNQRFSQSQQTPGGQGGGEGLDAALSETQKQIVAATFNLRRDEDSFSPDALRENLTTVGLSQGRLREQVETLVERMQARGIGQRDSVFLQITELLPMAAAEMTRAEDFLVGGDLSGAISAEQVALQQLLRAEAMYRDIQLASQQAGGGGGGGGAAEDLADLFDLELDRARNQYETVQRGEQQQADQQVDETLERLRELARRQQQEIERQRRAQNSNNRSGGGGQAQRELADQVEEVARQLETLSREQSLPELMESVQELRESADAMRRSSTRNDDRGLGEGVSALERLEQARELLDRSRDERLQRDMNDAIGRAQRLEEAQEDIRSDVEDLVRNNGGSVDDRRDISQRKSAMENELQDLERQITAMSREARRDQEASADQLAEAVSQISDSKIKEMVQLTRAVVERQPTRAGIYEEDIQSRLAELTGMLEQASEAIDQTRGPSLEDALEQTRELASDIRSLGERAQDRAEQRGESEEGQGGQTGEQQEGQGQEGQPGQQGGQQPGQAQGGQNGQPGNQQQGRADSGGGVPRDGAPGGTPGLNRDDIRQFRREARERVNEAEQLRDLLRREGVNTGNFDDILGRIRALDRQGTFTDLDEIEALQTQIVQGLMEFEFSLRRELQRGDPERLVLNGSDEVPDDYRDLVSEYYRALSEGRQ